MSGQEMGGGRVVQRQVGELCRKASKPPAWSLLLFELVRAFRPRNCIELGTCLGISAAYQAAALRLNGAGTLVTLEGAEALAGLSRLHLRELGLDNVTVVAGRFQDKLPGILRHGPPVDYAFIDGHHDEKATLEYYRLFLPALAGCAVLVFDDIAWSDGMRRAWSAIRSADGVGLSVDLGPVGLCVAGVAAPPRRAVGIPLSEAL
jgi:predicted O-methyltransferase YrrM